MKIAIAQQNYEIGNFGKNASKIIMAIFEARSQQADIIVFPEMCVCGNYPLDLLTQEEFMETTMQTLQRIATESYGIAVLLGCPTYCEDETETKVYNSAILIENGTITRRFNKKNLSLDEQRYFKNDEEKNIFEWKKQKIAVTLGNDICTESDATLAIHICAKPYVHKECNTFANNSIPTIFINQCGANTEAIFAGHSFVSDAQGRRIIQLPYFKDATAIYDTEATYDVCPEEKIDDIALLHDALVLGIHDYFTKNGFKTATLGLSGGIDSAVVLALAAEAIGSENIRVLLLPSEFSTSHSITDAEGLAKNLGVRYDIIPIKSAYDTLLSLLRPIFEDRPFSVAEENIQSRIRGVLLMALSNKLGNILLNTSNKSEIAVGYGTLYGDTNGSLSVLGDVYKTDVFKLARYINRDNEIIPENSIIKPPSAELRPGQQDSDSLPDYDTLDKILFLHIEKDFQEKDIIQQGFDPTVVKRAMQLVSRCEYKRRQLCPAIRVSSKPFADRRIPLIFKN